MKVRSTGPSQFTGGWAIAQLWLFWIAPIAGAVLAGLLHSWLGAAARRWGKAPLLRGVFESRAIIPELCGRRGRNEWARLAAYPRRRAAGLPAGRCAADVWAASFLVITFSVDSFLAAARAAIRGNAFRTAALFTVLLAAARTRPPPELDRLKDDHVSWLL